MFYSKIWRQRANLCDATDSIVYDSFWAIRSDSKIIVRKIHNNSRLSTRCYICYPKLVRSLLMVCIEYPIVKHCFYRWNWDRIKSWNAKFTKRKVSSYIVLSIYYQTNTVIKWDRHYSFREVHRKSHYLFGVSSKIRVIANLFKQNCRGTPVVYFDDAIVVNGYNVVVSDLNCSTTDARPEVLGRSQIS